MPTNQKTKKITIPDRIIEKYSQILKEYMDMLTDCKYIHDLPNPITNMYIGLNAIHRVFEYILIRTKNIEKVVYYSRKACYYYLEYMEQIYLTNLTLNLNQTDALLFVYKKTIFDLLNGENEDAYGTITNIMTMNDELINISDSILKPLLANISKCMNALFYWENNVYSLMERKEICTQHLDKYLYLILDKKMVLFFLEAVQLHSMIAFSDYMNLLKQILDFYDKKKKGAILDDAQIIDWRVDRFYIRKDEFHKKISDGNMKELVDFALVH
jgi:hypothetical protein